MNAAMVQLKKKQDSLCEAKAKLAEVKNGMNAAMVQLKEKQDALSEAKAKLRYSIGHAFKVS